MDLKEIRIWNVKYNLLSESEIADIVSKWIDEGKKGIHLTGVNGETVTIAQTDELLRTAIMDSDIVNVDSMLPAFFIKRKGYSLKKRVPSPDVMEELFKIANAKKQRVFFLGAKQETLNKLDVVLKKEYPNMIIAGMQNGYYNNEEEEEIVKTISSMAPDYLFIALPSPRKEHFILKNKKTINVGVLYGIGGALDAKSGVLKRPPKWFREYGMEAFLRITRKPKTYVSRIPLIFKFIKLALKNK